MFARLYCIASYAAQQCDFFDFSVSISVLCMTLNCSVVYLLTDTVDLTRKDISLLSLTQSPIHSPLAENWQRIYPRMHGHPHLERLTLKRKASTICV